MMLNEVEQLAELPISFSYQAPQPDDIQNLKQQATPVEIPANFPGLWLANTYFHSHVAGTDAKMFAREAVLLRLKAIAKRLAPKAGLIIYDVFRNRSTQQSLYDQFHQDIKNNHPDWSQDQIQSETLKFVSLPSLSAPHNSGGAIDLGVFNCCDSSIWDFGAELDGLSEISATGYFEQDYVPVVGFSKERWLTVRRNRRILFHLMIEQGFTNYHTEWWHYDLGDIFWSKQFKVDIVFPSME